MKKSGLDRWCCMRRCSRPWCNILGVEMYRVFLLNFGWFVEGAFDTLEAAIARAKQAGFEAVIYKYDTPVASWSIISGTSRNLS